MHRADFVLRASSRLVTCDRNPGSAGALGVIERGSVAARSGEILWVGPDSELEDNVELERNAIEVDASGCAVLPGLVDSHTHLIFSGDRSEEFAARLRGDPYSGGGIITTVNATRASSDDELLRLAQQRLDRFLGFGVTTVEAKSGYGLNPGEEARLVRLANETDHVVDVIPTFLGAHVVPPEFARNVDSYVEIVVEEMIPLVKELGAEFCDVWIDDAAFSVEHGRRVLTAAKVAGFQLKAHAEQLSHSGGAQLAAELGAVSADHLEFATEEDAKALADAGCVAILLPGASITTGDFAPARMLVDNGVRVAISTDFNPGTSYTENLQLIIALACSHLKMTPEEAILGATANAAAALGRSGRCGEISPGAICDLVILETRSEIDLPYHYGVNLTKQVVKRGEVVKL